MTKELTYDSTTNWLDFLLNKTNKLAFNEPLPKIHQPHHLRENKYHYSAEIQTHLKNPDADGRTNQKWRPKCIKQGCSKNNKWCCRVYHLPLCLKHFGSMHHTFEIAMYVKKF